jgi:hypothetical protein
MNKLLLSFWLILVILLLLSLWTEAGMWRLFGEASLKDYSNNWVTPARLIYVVGFLILIILIAMMHNKEKSTHPVMFFSFLLTSAFALCLWFWNMKMVWTTGAGDRFDLNSTVYIIPGFLAALVLVLAKDIVFARRRSKWWWLRKGGVLWGLGQVLSWGYPSFGSSLQKLSAWYDDDQARRLEDRYVEATGLPKEVLADKHPFGKWMIAEITLNYENNVYAMAYWGAAILILLIGLRGIKIIPKEQPTLVVVGLCIELTMLFMLGMVIFYKPEERKEISEPTHKEPNKVYSDEELKKLRETLRERLKKDVDQEIDKAVESTLNSEGLRE